MTLTEAKAAMWLEGTKTSRAQWKALQNILQSSPPQGLAALQSKDVLLDRFRLNLPRLKTFEIDMALDISKLPSRATSTQKIIAFDLVDVLTRILQSPEKIKHVYQGMAQMADEITDLGQSRCWGQSCRSTSGEFFRYPDGQPILPSDFVFYQCNESGCLKCTGKLWHLGRVDWCGRDMTTAVREAGTHGANTILIQEVISPENLPPSTQSDFENANPVSDAGKAFQEEFILVEDSEYRILPSHVKARVPSIKICYDYAPTDNKSSYNPGPSTFFIRYVLTREIKSLRPVVLSNPHMGELELSTFGREHFI